MKILQIAPRYYPSLGGVEEVVKQYSERLVRDFGHELTVFTSDIDSDGSSIVNGVRVNRFKTLPFLRKGPFMPITLGLGFKLLTNNADLWHLHANKRFTTDLASCVDLIKKKPFVYSTHAGIFGSSLLGKIHNQTISKLAFRAQAVIFGTNFEKNLVEKSGLRVKNPQVLPIGVDINEFKNADYLLEEKFGLKEKQVILFVGRLTKHKGLDTLIKAMPAVLKNNSDAKILAIGPDFGEKSALKKLADDQGVGDSVIFAGSVKRNELLGAYKKAAVFCLPSRNEAFGLVIIEAMAAGAPVIVAGNSAMPEIVEDGKSGLVFDTENYSELSDRINTLLTDRKLKEILLNNAALDVAEKYNWENIVGKLNKIYLEALK